MVDTHTCMGNKHKTKKNLSPLNRATKASGRAHTDHCMQTNPDNASEAEWEDESGTCGDVRGG